MEVLIFLQEVLKLMWKILITPWLSSEGLWAILPLVIILIFINLYFGRNRSEELGWNSAFGNTISLLWVCVILWKFLITNHAFVEIFSHPLVRDFILLSILSVWVLLLSILNFFHVLPRKFAFIISSSYSLYILGYIVISFVIGDVVITKTSLLGAIILFIFMFMLSHFLKWIVPIDPTDKPVLEKRHKKKAHKKRAKKATRTKKRKNLFKKIFGKKQ